MEAKPDAIMCPVDAFSRPGEDIEAQSYNLFLAARTILGVEQPSIFVQGPKRFVATSAHQSLFFSKMHASAGQPRYRWEPMEGNEKVQLGYLKEEAKDAPANP